MTNIFCRQLRARLFKFDENAKEWKERGLGTVKILRHRLQGSYRVLMRREQTLKICANHKLGPELQLRPMAASERAWTYATADWSDAQVCQKSPIYPLKEPYIITKIDLFTFAEHRRAPAARAARAVRADPRQIC